jgi:lipopolysaccharide transport system permease protein
VLTQLIKNLWLYRELLAQLVGREIKARYKQSILGYFWVILNPFFQLLVMSFVFAIILRVNVPGVSYVLFLYTGLLPWTFFANSLTAATQSLVTSRNLLKKVKFPREILPLSSVIAKIVDLGMAGLTLIPFFIYYRRPINICVLWFVPILATQIIFTAGLALLLAALNLFYRDIKHLFSLILRLWMYLTPIFYPIDIVPDRFRWVYKLNPMSVLINAYRQGILAGKSPIISHLFLALVVSLVVLSTGYFIFKRLEKSFADIV